MDTFKLLNGGYMVHKLLFRALLPVAFISAFAIHSARAVFVYGEGFKKDDVTVVIIGDIHRDKPPFLQTKKQLSDLITTAKKHSAYCIVEDTCEYDGQNELRELVSQMKNFNHIIKTHDGITKEHSVEISPLGGFCKEARQNNIVAISCEFRFSIPNLFGTSNEQILEIKELIAKLEKSIIGQNNLFREYLKNIFDKFNLSQTPQAFDQLYNSLLDMNTICELSTILEKKTHKFIIICVGGHIPRISKIIQNVLHFKKIAQTEPRFDDTLPSYIPTQKIAEKVVSAYLMYPIDIPTFFDAILNKNNSQAMARIHNTLNHLQPTKLEKDALK